MTTILSAVDGSCAYLRLGTLVLISFLSTTSQYYILWPYHIQSTPLGRSLHFGLFNLGIFFIYWTFFLVCRDPGQVDSTYIPPQGVEVRYCKKCELFKPPRTHHCKRCGRCVLRMDHHCPWLSSCIGYKNHAAFLKFLSWVIPTTGYLSIVSGKSLYSIVNHGGADTTEASVLIIIIMNLIGAFATFMMVICLYFYQVWCVLENITTIESWNKGRLDELTQKNKIASIEFPYDLYSSTKNVREILGYHHPLVWLWPPSKATGSGHEFPLNEDADLARPWPPKDFLDSKPAIRTSPSVLHNTVHEEKMEPTWDDYAEAGYMSDSDESNGDYANAEGEFLDNYGVDDNDETTELDGVVKGNLTLAQLLSEKRAGRGTARSHNQQPENRKKR